MRPDRRGKRRDEACETGKILADHIDRRGTGAGDYERRLGRLQKPRHMGAYRFRAVRRLAHARESCALQGGGKLTYRHSAEITGETRRYRRVNLSARGEQLPKSGEIAANFLRVLRTDLNALSAGDARL